MDASVAEVTVNVVDPEMPMYVAVIVVCPEAMGMASPLEPPALLTSAIPLFDELQVTRGVRSCTVPSEKLPLAENCWDSPMGVLGLVGVTSIETSVAESTVSTVLPETPSNVAVIVADPVPTDLASPLETVATAVLSELHETAAVRSSVVLSE